MIKKPITALIAVMISACALAACGNADSSDGVSLPQTETSAVTTAAEATEPVTELTTTTEAVTEEATTTTPEETTTTTEEITTATPETTTTAVTTTTTTATQTTTTTAKATTTTKKATTTVAKTTTISATTTTAKKVVSYDGTNRLEGVLIGIDPGHQRKGNSAQETVAPGSTATKAKVSQGTSGVSTGIAEYVTNLEIALMLRAKLEAEGATVYMTRESHDVDISNQERTKMMNDYGVDLMLRIHCDGAANSSARGIGLFVSKSNSIAAQSYKYAQTMMPYIIKYTGAKDRGVTQNDDYTGQNWAQVPCMMIECGFLSNAEDDKLLNSEGYQEKLTDGILEGIVACFSE